ncbi:MAG: metallophosphoesterase [Verrucomicrobiae bacterium]|nr:metallophosphoesterase [Verrucomicrobiae bacterium]
MTPSSSILWFSDLHLDLLDRDCAHEWAQSVAARHPGIILISGDISNGEQLGRHLRIFAQTIRVPVYFVLGNHDYYGGRWKETDQQVARACRVWPHLHHLGIGEVASLSPEIGLIGHGGWGDGRAGKVTRLEGTVLDFYTMSDFEGCNERGALALIQSRGDVAAAALRKSLAAAWPQFKEIWILMHVPPFPEAVLGYHGLPASDPVLLPFYCCAAAGDVIREAAENHPEIKLTVLCGHTHTSAVIRILPNLEVQVHSSDSPHLTVFSKIDLLNGLWIESGWELP